MTTSDLFTLFSVIATFLVSLIALFKEQIQSIFIKVKFDVQLQNGGLDEEVENGQAIRYSSYVEIPTLGKSMQMSVVFIWNKLNIIHKAAILTIH